ncbi:uncharacterized protein LOC115634355 [Scaptodrosophila lebanonensis]|uniref:Uncharacterized protein LOC115634355 n=1 Tax=Drosophila lebanonensis TaxID=7225 RepID=A0A6J2UI86_DROLE|nr:uncharacterized protein LOC115634355 [Scaptodrosophila lebanonensis]
MYLLPNSMLTALAIVFAMSQLQCDDAMHTGLEGMDVVRPKNGTNGSQIESAIKTNSTSVLISDAPQSNSPNPKSRKPAVKSLKHIARSKRETEPTMPFDFHTLHAPCDWDTRGRVYYIEYFPNHCIWVWNNKNVHEGFFRAYKTYELEGFFFGQLYERLKRFEIDPHSWDYSDMEVID